MALVGNDFDGSNCRLLCGDVKAKECSCRHRSHSDCEDANDDVTSTCLIRLRIGLFHGESELHWLQWCVVADPTTDLGVSVSPLGSDAKLLKLLDKRCCVLVFFQVDVAQTFIREAGKELTPVWTKQLTQVGLGDLDPTMRRVGYVLKRSCFRHVPPNEMDLCAAMRAAEKGRSPLVQPSMHQKGISSRVGSTLAESSALG